MTKDGDRVASYSLWDMTDEGMGSYQVQKQTVGFLIDSFVILDCVHPV